jgi:hypothetical protein
MRSASSRMSWSRYSIFRFLNASKPAAVDNRLGDRVGGLARRNRAARRERRLPRRCAARTRGVGRYVGRRVPPAALPDVPRDHRRHPTALADRHPDVQDSRGGCSWFAIFRDSCRGSSPSRPASAMFSPESLRRSSLYSPYSSSRCCKITPRMEASIRPDKNTRREK